jgi:hypothetical protein
MLPVLPYPVAGPSDAAFTFATQQTMQRAFGFTPFAWQDDILCHLFKMASARHSVAPAPTFLCQPTGGGKSLVRDVFASGRMVGLPGALDRCWLWVPTKSRRSTNEAFQTMGRLSQFI